jgi:hypothetical protein
MADKKQSLTFEQMYGRLENPDTPEKVSGTPVSRSSRSHLEELEEKLRGQS